MHDITGAEAVQVQINRDGRVLWVTVDGETVLRICRITSLFLHDERAWEVITDRKEEVSPYRSTVASTPRVTHDGTRGHSVTHGIQVCDNRVGPVHNEGHRSALGLPDRTVVFPITILNRDMVPCPICDARVEYVADWGAPGRGQSWRCTECQAEYALVGTQLYLAASGVHIMEPWETE